MISFDGKCASCGGPTDTGGSCPRCVDTLPAPPKMPGHALGWECPKCGSVYSPYVDACRVCVPQTITISSAGWPNKQLDLHNYRYDGPVGDAE